MPNRPKPAPGTSGHYISKVPDDLWLAAQAEATRRGESVSEAVRRFLTEYAKGEDVATLAEVDRLERTLADADLEIRHLRHEETP